MIHNIKINNKSLILIWKILKKNEEILSFILITYDF